MPIPVDLIEVGKLYELIKLNKANATVLNNLLLPKKIISSIEVEFVN
jgi:hypothetical protein